MPKIENDIRFPQGNTPPDIPVQRAPDSLDANQTNESPVLREIAAHPPRHFSEISFPSSAAMLRESQETRHPQQLLTEVLLSEREWAIRLAEAIEDPSSVQALLAERAQEVPLQSSRLLAELNDSLGENVRISPDELSELREQYFGHALREQVAAELGGSGENVDQLVDRLSSLSTFLPELSVTETMPYLAGQAIMQHLERMQTRYRILRSPSRGVPDVPFGLSFTEEQYPGETSGVAQHRHYLMRHSEEEREQIVQGYSSYLGTDGESLRLRIGSAERDLLNESVMEGWLLSQRSRSWQEVRTELSSTPALEHFDETMLQRKFFLIRMNPLIERLAVQRNRDGFLMEPATRHQYQPAIEERESIARKIDDIEASIATLLSDAPPGTNLEAFREFQEQLSTEAHQAGLSAWSEYLEGERREAVIEHGNRGAGQRAAEVLWQALTHLPKLAESGAAFVGVFNGYNRGALEALLSGQNPMSGAIEGGGEYIESSRAFFNQNMPGGSLFGSDREFADSTLFENGLNLHPFSHVSGAIVDPVFGLLEVGRTEAARRVYQGMLLGGGPVSYEEYTQLEEEDSLLAAGRGAFHLGEGAAALAFLRMRGFGTATPLAVAGGFGAASGLAGELRSDGEMSFSRFLDNSITGASHSALFMAALGPAAQSYASIRYGGTLPSTPAAWQGLQISSPARFMQAQRAVFEAQMFQRAVDFLDAQGDLSQALQSFDGADSYRQLAGSVLQTLVAGADMVDLQIALPLSRGASGPLRPEQRDNWLLIEDAVDSGLDSTNHAAMELLTPEAYQTLFFESKCITMLARRAGLSAEESLQRTYEYLRQSGFDVQTNESTTTVYVHPRHLMESTRDSGLTTSFGNEALQPMGVLSNPTIRREQLVHENAEAAYDWSTNEIIIAPDLGPSRNRQLISHELEHALQVEFVAAAHLAGSQLPAIFYEADGSSNIHPDVLAAVEMSGRHLDEMHVHWGENIAQLIAIATTQQQSGEVQATSPEMLLEQTARLTELLNGPRDSLEVNTEIEQLYETISTSIEGLGDISVAAALVNGVSQADGCRLYSSRYLDPTMRERYNTFREMQSTIWNLSHSQEHGGVGPRLGAMLIRTFPDPVQDREIAETISRIVEEIPSVGSANKAIRLLCLTARKENVYDVGILFDRILREYHSEPDIQSRPAQETEALRELRRELMGRWGWTGNNRGTPPSFSDLSHFVQVCPEMNDSVEMVDFILSAKTILGEDLLPAEVIQRISEIAVAQEASYPELLLDQLRQEQSLIDRDTMDSESEYRGLRDYSRPYSWYLDRE